MYQFTLYRVVLAMAGLDGAKQVLVVATYLLVLLVFGPCCLALLAYNLFFTQHYWIGKS